MHSNYSDIISRIAKPPKWYDANGTPRYDDFHPKLCPDIYSNQVVLLRIACQAFGQQFNVEVHAGLFQELHPKKCHYGDPPIHDCAGDTMNADDLNVLQVWYKYGLGQDGVAIQNMVNGEFVNISGPAGEYFQVDPGTWVRHRELEGIIDGRV